MYESVYVVVRRHTLHGNESRTVLCSHLEVPCHCGIWSTAAHEGVARGNAHLRVAMCLLKYNRLCGKLVQVRCLHEAVSIRTHLGAKVVDKNVQNRDCPGWCRWQWWWRWWPRDDAFLLLWVQWSLDSRIPRNEEAMGRFNRVVELVPLPFGASPSAGAPRTALCDVGSDRCITCTRTPPDAAAVQFDLQWMLIMISTTCTPGQRIRSSSKCLQVRAVMDVVHGTLYR